MVGGHDGDGFVVHLTVRNVGGIDVGCFKHAVSRPGSVGKERPCISNVPREGADEIAGKSDSFTLEGAVFNKRGFARALQFASVLGGKGAAGGFDGVVVRHRPDVSKDERGFRNWVAVERFIPGP